MEPQPQIDMNQLIQKWRSNLEQSEHLNADRIDELESHLRDEIDALKTDLLNSEEKVLVACHRLGSVNTLEKAYRQSRIFDFQNISVFAQVLFGIVSLLALSKVSLVVSLNIHETLGWSESTNMVIVYFLLQLIAATGLFLATRCWIKMIIQSKQTVKANIYGISTILSSYALFAIAIRVADINYIMNAPLFLSAFNTIVFALFILGFMITTISVWLKRKKHLALA